MRYFYGGHYGGGGDQGQDVVVEPDDADEKIYNCDSVMPPTLYMNEECMDDELPSQKPSKQVTTVVPKDESSQEIPQYDEFKIDFPTPLVIADDLLVENEEIVKTLQATLPTGTRTHEETAKSTGAQKYEETTPPTADQKHEGKMIIDFPLSKVPDIIVFSNEVGKYDFKMYRFARKYGSTTLYRGEEETD
ncbi:hypothetical protein CEXT_167631 [Caerostris extrusa]|uniref:Uncharacterized protein n=1 Tax=Caerostris extrusa TaxID=172846 RepID=A0AAV4Y7X5_CAEEX|nr:hypothetical protein CEXT_167631 [Caerostris extrusa]